MNGCVIGAGETECDYLGSCSMFVETDDPVGQSADKSTTYSVTGTCQGRRVNTQGNQGANYCTYLSPQGTTGDTLTTYSSKGVPVSHKQLEICTDEVQVVSNPPVLTLKVTVARVLNGEVNCEDSENLPTDEIDVIAPVDVAYCYTLRNDGLTNIAEWTITADNGTPEDEDDVLELSGSDLAGGTSVQVDSGIVLVENTGVLINTAKAEGFIVQGDTDPCPTCTDSDTATVNIIVQCDATTQGQASSTDSVVEKSSPQGTNICGPKTDDNNFNSVSLLCDSSCELRPECGGDLVNFPSGKPSLCPQPCKASGNWTSGINDPANGSISGCSPNEPSPGNLPLCQEVLGNLTNNGATSCVGIQNPKFIRRNGNHSEFGINPYVYYFDNGSAGGGNNVGTIICYLYPGDTIADCPAGSIIY